MVTGTVVMRLGIHEQFILPFKVAPAGGKAPSDDRVWHVVPALGHARGHAGFLQLDDHSRHTVDEVGQTDLGGSSSVGIES